MKRLFLFVCVCVCVVPLMAPTAFGQTPTLSSVSPATGIQGATLSVTLTGSNFVSGTSAVTSSSAAIAVASFRVVSATQIDALLVLNGTPGTYSLRVANSSASSSTASFTITPSPWTSASELDVTSFAGPEGGAGYTDGPASTARYSSPAGIWGDGTYLYIADALNSVIRRIKAGTGEVTTIAGTAGSRGSRDGIGPEARFWTPFGLWGVGGSLYITDIGNYTVRKLDLAANTVTTMAGTPSSAGTTDGTFAKFVGPTGIWGDETSLYVADSVSLTTRSIRKITIATGAVSTVADLGASLVLPLYPVGLWGDGTILFIADSSRHTIRRMALNTGTITTLAGSDNRAGSQDSTGTSALFSSPSGVWGAGSTLYVADTLNYTIRSVSTQNGQVTTLNGAARIPGWADGVRAQVRFSFPAGIWGTGTTLYVTELRNNAVRKINTASGDSATLSGYPATPGSTDGSLASARFFAPSSLWGDAGNLYISDYVNGTIRKLALDTGQVSTLVGAALFFGSRDSSGAAALFGSPWGLWGDGVSLYVTDAFFDTVRKIDIATRVTSNVAGNASLPSGSTDGVGGSALFRAPLGIWGDGTNLYVADSGNYTIRKIVIATRQTSVFAGVDRTRGIEDSASGTAHFYLPQAIWGDGTNLYVVDGNAIRKIVIATREVTTLAGSPATQGYADGRAALFYYPSGIWGEGTNLLVADTGNHVIRKIEIATGIVSTVAGSYPIAGSETGRGSAAHFYLPYGLWGSGNTLYLLDSWNHKIRKAAAAPAAPPSTNPADITYRISNRGGLSRNTTGADSTIRVGYSRIIPDTGNSAPAGIAIFGFTQNGTLVSEAAVPASSLIQTGRIYAEINPPVNTGVAIANPNSQPVTLSFYFTDSSGTNVNSGSTVIPGYGQIAAFLNESPFVSSSVSQSSLASMRTFTFSASSPISAVALRGFTNERSEFLITTLPIVSLDNVGAGQLSFPHFADGGGWKTDVILVNPTDSTLTGAVQFFSQGSAAASGAATSLTVNGATGSSFDYSIPARSSFKLQTSNTDAATRAGWVRVSPGSGSRTPSGLVVFSFRRDGVTVSEAGVQAQPTASAFRLYAEAAGDFNGGASGSIQTGFAISNPASAAVTVNFELTGLDGVSTGLNGSATVPATGQVAMFLNQVSGFSGLPVPFKGILRISGANVSVVGLRARYNEAGNFLITTTPPIDESSSPTTAQLLFPHFVDGGGYTTQFILFSALPNQAPAGSLRFYTQAGAGLNVQLR